MQTLSLHLYRRQPHTFFSLLIDIIATAAPIVSNTHDIIRKRVNMASTDTKKRKRKPYKSKALMMEHLGFGQDRSKRSTTGAQAT